MPLNFIIFVRPQNRSSLYLKYLYLDFDKYIIILLSVFHTKEKTCYNKFLLIFSIENLFRVAKKHVTEFKSIIKKFDVSENSFLTFILILPHH